MHEEPWDAEAGPSEAEVWAEHRAALDATLFAGEPPLVIEL